MRANEGARPCKNRQLVILLLLCAVITAAQYCRQTYRQSTPLTVHTRPVIYELRGEVAQPGMYRYMEEQTTAALAAACGADYIPLNKTCSNVASGSRLIFNGAKIAAGRMDADILLSYHQPISLNAATAEELELIPGIGPKTAKSLIEFRQRTGTIKHLDQLIEVRGIGPKTLKKITRYLKP